MNRDVDKYGSTEQFHQLHFSSFSLCVLGRGGSLGSCAVRGAAEGWTGMDGNRTGPGVLRTSPSRSTSSKSVAAKASASKHTKSKSAKITSLHTSLTETEVSCHVRTWGVFCAF